MLEIEHLSCGYDSNLILHDINLKIDKGEIVGIIGPNGSGKTTLLRAITGVITPKKGKVIFEGTNINKLRYKELAKRIAVVSQNSEIGYTSVEEFVLLGRIPHFERFQFLESREDTEICQRYLDMTDTLSLKNQLMTEISGGERQLALIARALCQEPKLILLDEPISHLDISHQVRILDLIRRLNKEFGLTVVMILHDLNLASEYCQRLILLNKGRIHKIGSCNEVLTYSIIEEVYKTVVVIEDNPISSKPYILVVSEEERQKRGAKWKEKV